MLGRFCGCRWSFGWCRFLGCEDMGAITESGFIDIAARVVTFALLGGCKRAGAFFEILEFAEVAAGEVLRVLQGDDVLSAEFLVADEVSPHLSFDIETLDSLPGENIACGFQGYNVRVVREYFEGDRIHHLSIVILGESQFHQLGRLEGLVIDWVSPMLEKPG